jgi:hypothetical protein
MNTQSDLFGGSSSCGQHGPTKCPNGHGERCICKLPAETADQKHAVGHICGKCHGAIVATPTTAAELDCPPSPQPPTGRNAGDTSRAAAEKMALSVGTWRRKVLAIAERSGHWGVTGSEAVRRLEAQDSEYTVRPRLTELAGERYGDLLVRTAWRRPNPKGNLEIVYVLRTHYVAAIHDDARRLEALTKTPTVSPTLPTFEASLA